MNNTTVKLKVQQRINKLGSKDYDNIQDWQLVEAFNKGVVGWCRRNLQGTNLTKTGDEATIAPRRVLTFRPSHLLKDRVATGKS